MPHLAARLASLFPARWMAARRTRRHESRRPAMEQLESRAFLDAVPLSDTTQVNADDLLEQDSTDIAVAANGQYVVTWDSAQDGMDATGYDIYARIFNANGTPAGEQFKVNSGTGFDANSPRVAIDATGDFVIVWEATNTSTNDIGVHFRRYDSSGAAQGDQVDLTASSGVYALPDVAMDADGNFAVVFLSGAVTFGEGAPVITSADALMMRYNASGQAITNSPVTANTGSETIVNRPAIGMNADGAFVVAWAAGSADFFVDLGGGDQQGPYSRNGVIKAQRYNASGVAQGSAVSVSTAVSGVDAYDSPSIALDDSGNFVIAYTGSDLTVSGSGNSATVTIDNTAIFARKIGSNGTAAGAQFKVNPSNDGTDDTPRVAVDGSGNFVITWMNDPSPLDNTDERVRARYYSSAGVPASEGFGVDSAQTNASEQSSPSVAMTASGDFIFSWNAFINGQNMDPGDMEIFMRAFEPPVITSGIDLVASFNSVTFAEPIVPGDKGKAVVTVQNAGTVAMSGAIRVDLYASRGDRTLDIADRKLVSSAVTTVKLAAGGTKAFSFTPTIPVGAMPGDYHLIAVIVDVNGTISETDENNVFSTEDTGQVVWQFGQVESRKNVKLQLIDADGTLVTFAMTGAGTGRVIAEDEAVTSFNLQATGTTTTSGISVTTKKSSTPGDDGRVKLTHTLVGGEDSPGDGTSIGKFDAKNADVLNSFYVNGSVGTLTLGNVNSVGEKTLHVGATTGVSTSITLGRVSDLSFTADNRIKSLTAVEWLDTADTASNGVFASAIDTLKITGSKTLSIPGDFQPSLTLGGDGVTTPLSNFSAAGTVGRGGWTISGDVGKVSAGATAENFLAEVSGDWASLASTMGNLSGTIQASSIKSVTAKADLRDAVFTLTEAFSSTARAIDKLSVGAAIDGVTILAQAGINSISAVSVIDTLIYVGVTATTPPLPSLLTELSHPQATIGSLTFKGTKASPNYANTLIAAGVIGKASLGWVDVRPVEGPVSQGVAAGTISSLSYSNGTASFKPTKFDTVDDTVTDGSFTVRVLS